MRALAAALLLAAPLAWSQDKPVDAGPYVPSLDVVVTRMLELAQVNKNDFIIDLGSGDGRIVRAAALLYGARGFGVEIKDELVRQSNADAAREGIADRVKFVKGDLFKTDISQATVLTMYLLPNTVNMLRAKLLSELEPGTRVLSHDYPLAGWIPEKYVQMDLEDKVKISGVTTTLIYLYVVPAQVEGRWRAELPSGAATLDLKQQITRVSGSARIQGRDVPLADLKLRGEQLSFRLYGRTYQGRVRGAAIEGDGGQWSAERAR